MKTPKSSATPNINSTHRTNYNPTNPNVSPVMFKTLKTKICHD